MYMYNVIINEDFVISLKLVEILLCQHLYIPVSFSDRSDSVRQIVANSMFQINKIFLYSKKIVYTKAFENMEYTLN